MKKIILISLLLFSCGEEPLKEKLISCGSQEDQTGVYLISLSQRDNGTCGAMPLMRIELKNGEIQPIGETSCDVARTYWEAKTCTTESDFECMDDLFYMTLKWKFKTYVGFNVEFGDRIVGTLDLDMEDLNTEERCFSVYDLNLREI